MAGPEDGVPEGVPSRGETAAMVEAEQLDPRRRAEQDVAEAEARMWEWVRTRRTYEASMPFAGAPDEFREVRQFTVTVQPFVGGPDAAFKIRTCNADMRIEDLRAMVQTAHPQHPAPDEQRLVVGDGKDEATLEDETLPAGAYRLMRGGFLAVRMGVRDGRLAAQRREARVALRAERAAAAADSNLLQRCSCVLS